MAKPAKLKDFIKEHGPIEASKRLKIPRMTLHRWITGKAFPSQMAIEKLAKHRITV